MRPFRVALALAASLSAVACGCGARATREELAVRAAQPIQGGSIDTGDPAVVGIVIQAGGGLAVCSGALIAPNLVLTAHHCVSQAASSSTACSTSSFGAAYPASALRITSSHDAAAGAYAAGTLPSIDSDTWFGAAKVTVAGEDLCGQDMAVVELSKPMSGVCPLVPRIDSAVSEGEGYAAVGFGITSPSAAAAGTRYRVGGLAVLCAGSCGGETSSTLEWIGGSAAAKGACEGDSGGPALDSDGRILGTVSRGPTASCNQTVYEATFGAAAWLEAMAQQAASDGGYPVAGWVTGGATSDPENGYCGSGIVGGGSDAGAGDGGAPGEAGDSGLGRDADSAAHGEVDSGAVEGEIAATRSCVVVGGVGSVAPFGTALVMPSLALAMVALARRRRD